MTTMKRWAVRHATTLPVLVALAAYLAVLLSRVPSIVHHVTSNSDAVSPMLLTEEGLARDYTVQYTQVWLNVLTLHLPDHRALWLLLPAAMSCVGIGVTAWSVRRVWGTAAAVVTLALCVAAAPLLIFPMLAQGFHSGTSLVTALLAAYLVWLGTATRPSRLALWAVSGAVAVILAAGLVSDYLLLLAAFVPALVVLVAIATRTDRSLAEARLLRVGSLGVGGGLLLGVVAGAPLHLLRQSAGFAKLDLATAPTAVNNVRLLGRSVLSMVHGAFLGRPLTVMALVSAGAAALLALLVVAAARVLPPMVTSRVGGQQILLGFWLTSIAAVSIGFVFSTLPDGLASARYLTTAWWGIAVVGGALTHNVASRRFWLRVACAAGVTVVIALNALSVARSAHDGTLVATGPSTSGVGDLDALAAALEARGLHQGYAGFWQANALTWMTHGDVTSRSVLEGRFCSSLDPGAVCPDRSFTDPSWYDGNRGPTFLVVRPGVPGEYVRDAPSASLGQSLTSFEVEGFVVYSYADDISRRFIPD